MNNDFSIIYNLPLKGFIATDNGVLIVKEGGDECYLKEVTLSNGELKVTYQKRNWEYVDGLIVSQQSIWLIQKAIPDYIKTIPGYYKKTWFGKKWIPERRILKTGLIELQPNEYKTVVTNQYRIYGFK